mmetsp:Transcript_27806/g.83027  ORF Transcript_27806/g.83027 Transcript_27806/m.83027 type:complete len:212 (-) Transcript_27806:655-1290(-)
MAASWRSTPCRRRTTPASCATCTSTTCRPSSSAWRAGSGRLPNAAPLSWSAGATQRPGRSGCTWQAPCCAWAWSPPQRSPGRWLTRSSGSTTRWWRSWPPSGALARSTSRCPSASPSACCWASCAASGRRLRWFGGWASAAPGRSSVQTSPCCGRRQGRGWASGGARISSLWCRAISSPCRTCWRARRPPRAPWPASARGSRRETSNLQRL